MKEKLVMLFRRVVQFARNVSGNRGDNDKGKLGPKFEWPHVMSSSVAKHGSLVSGTWIWHHQHARWHHGYYRTRRQERHDKSVAVSEIIARYLKKAGWSWGWVSAVDPQGRTIWIVRRFRRWLNLPLTFGFFWKHPDTYCKASAGSWA